MNEQTTPLEETKEESLQNALPEEVLEETVADIELPDVELPDVELPGVEVSEADVAVPQMAVADIELPDVELPDVELPDVELPGVEVSEADVAAPEVTVADIELPDVELPDVELPDVELPGIEAPDQTIAGVVADVALPDVDMADMSAEEPLEFEVGESAPEIEVSKETEKDAAKLMKSVAGPPEYVPNEKMGRVQRIGNDVRFSDINYKNIQLLSRFLDRHARIIPRRKTHVSAKVQRQVVKSVKRARYLALLPYTGNQTRIVRKKR